MEILVIDEPREEAYTSFDLSTKKPFLNFTYLPSTN